MKVGWVKGLNRLYFLYEAYDNYWDFSRPGLHNDIFEVVVDGDLSGGPLIERFQPTKELSERDAHFSMHGVHAQNYHIMTPAVGKDWALAWGCNSYVKKLPYANAAYNYNFKPGESGKADRWNFGSRRSITPAARGRSARSRSVLTENKLIGLAWAILDYDDANSESHAFWNLSRQHTMYGKADELVAFRLMPLEPQFRNSMPTGASRWWTWTRRLVAFQDEIDGQGDVVEMGLRGWLVVHGATSDAYVQGGRRLHRDVGSGRSRGQIAAGKDLGCVAAVMRACGFHQYGINFRWIWSGSNSS